MPPRHLPQHRGGHAHNLRLRRHFRRLSAGTEITTRPWDSPKSSASSRSCGAGMPPRAEFSAMPVKINFRPIKRGVSRAICCEMQHSASATAQAAIAAIMRALDRAGINQRPQRKVQVFFLYEVATRRRAGLQSVNALQIRRTAQT